MYRYYHILFALFVTFSSVAQTQVGSILQGYIRSDGRPIPFVNIALIGTTRGIVSDSLGQYKITGISAGTYIIRSSGIGYRSYETTISFAENERKSLNINLEAEESSLNEVIITGTMRETFTTQSPVPVEVFTPAFFRKNPTPSLFEALQNVNGVRPQLNCNVCNTGDIHINGMEGPYTMVLIDGMPIVSALSTVYGLNGIPNSLIERVEIVKGAASSLYGSEAVGGLINVITKNPNKAPKISTDLMATSYGEYNADLGLLTQHKKMRALTGINYFNFSKIHDKNNDNFTDITLQKRISVFEKLSWERKENRTANLAFRYLYEDRWGGEKQWTRALRRSDSIYAESVYTQRWELIGNHQLPVANEKITLNYSLNRHEQNAVYGLNSYNALQQIGFGQFVWEKPYLNHNLLLGSALRFTEYNDNTAATPQRQHTWLPGIFVQDELTLNARHVLLGGLRYDYNSQHGHVLTPRAAWKFANNDYIFRLNIGKGFRVVNLFTEDHAALTGAREVVVRNHLRPEQSWNTNANLQRTFTMSKGYFNAEASLFYTYFSNRIVPDYTSNVNQIIYDNLDGYAVSRGLTFNGEFNYEQRLRGNIGFTLMDVFQRQKNAQSGDYEKISQVQAAPFSGTFGISYTYDPWGITLDWTGNFYSQMPLPTLPNDFRPSHSPWFSLQNIQCTKKFANGLAIYGGAKNLLNFVPKNPLMRPFDPFDKTININNPNGYSFDTAYNYAPLQGIRGFLGLRYALY